MTNSFLVVDDDESFRNTLVRSLIRRGFEAFGTETGELALSLLRERRFSRVVLDLKMRGELGIDLIPQLLAVNSEVAIVILTGYGSIATAQEAIKRGAHYYLTKPCDTERVLAAFEEGSARVNPPPPSLAQVEWEHIQRVLLDCEGNITKAAKLLQLDRRSLQRKLGKVPKVK